MKSTNAVQERYMVAKSVLDTLKSEGDEIEKEFCASHSITDEDGKCVDHVWMMDNDARFDQMNAELSELPECKQNFAAQLIARENLLTAEDALIKYGLSIAPASIRETLTSAAKTDSTTRAKLINLVLRLNVATVR